jgi:hypothetical protein
MPQIALPLGSDPALTATALPAQRLDPVGFRIGWDHARHGVTPPVDDLHLGHPVRQGWEAGRAAGARRPVADTQAVRRWLGLRLMAWRCGREVDEETVTLREVLMLDVSRCPVTRTAFPCTRPGLAPGADDALVLAMDREGPIRAGMLVIVSRRAAQAAMGVDAASADETARVLAAQAPDAQRDGLDAGAWGRLASLLSMREWPPHTGPATLPLSLLPPPRLALLHPAHALQSVLTWRFAPPATGPAPSTDLHIRAGRSGGIGSLGGLDRVGIDVPGAEARRCYFQFLSALLARRLASGPRNPDTCDGDAAFESAWGHPLLRARWDALVTALGEDGCARLAQAVARTTAGAAVPWHLPPARSALGAASAPCDRAARASRRPVPSKVTGRGPRLTPVPDTCRPVAAVRPVPPSARGPVRRPDRPKCVAARPSPA